jgi:ParB family chromosome partitioning protein
MNRKALGRGLGALLSSDRSTDIGAEPAEVPVASISAGPMQPRSHFDEASLQNLAESIKTHGVVQPLVVRPKGDEYELIAGERRWRAAQIAGLERVPVVIRNVPDENLLEIALIENIQREDLNPIEEAIAYKRLIESVGLSQDALAARVGRDRSYITNYLRLLRLPDDIQKLVKEGRLSPGHARTLVSLEAEDLQRRLARQIVEGALSVRATEELVKKAGNKGGNGPTPRPSTAVDPNVRAAETKLRRVLGAQVKILQAADGRGKIEIGFSGEQDLNRLYDLITRGAAQPAFN